MGSVVRLEFIPITLLPEGFGARGLFWVFVAVGSVVKFEFISIRLFPEGFGA